MFKPLPVNSSLAPASLIALAAGGTAAVNWFALVAFWYLTPGPHAVLGCAGSAEVRQAAPNLPNLL